MTKLSTLHARLANLRRRRRLVRVATGAAGLVIALIVVLVALFLVDWLLHMTQVQRAIALLLAAAGLVWAFQRYARPWFGHRETEVDVALMVERQHQIDSDLVAALQFERPEAQKWGSVALEDQVIDYTAEIGTQLDVHHDIPRKDLNRRAMLLGAVALVLAILVVLFPQHALVFLDRLLLGNRHYPTRTEIVSVSVNGHTVDLSARRPQVVTCPYGQPVRFEARCSGDLPATGNAALTSESGGLQTKVPLDPTAKQQGMYVGSLPRLVEAVSYQLYLGDAWTPAGRLVVVPLPTIDVQLEVTPPSYARDTKTSAAETTGLRHISVIEGSRVAVRLTSDKPLREATFSIDDKACVMAQDSSNTSKSNTERWILKPTGTPLDSVTEAIHYSIQVTDTHGLQLEHPIQGAIRIKADLRPRVNGTMLTRYVLPSAKPSLSYSAADDYGLARLSVLAEVIHADGSTDTRPEIVLYELAEGQTPRKEIQDRKPIDLAPLEAVKGDQIKLTLQAVDYRGQQPGKTGTSEPLVLQVTDEEGILAAMSETDKESARQLQSMIQRQLDVGDKP